MPGGFNLDGQPNTGGVTQFDGYGGEPFTSSRPAPSSDFGRGSGFSPIGENIDHYATFKGFVTTDASGAIVGWDLQMETSLTTGLIPFGSPGFSYNLGSRYLVDISSVAGNVFGPGNVSAFNYASTYAGGVTNRFFRVDQQGTGTWSSSDDSQVPTPAIVPLLALGMLGLRKARAGKPATPAFA